MRQATQHREREVLADGELGHQALAAPFRGHVAQARRRTPAAVHRETGLPTISTVPASTGAAPMMARPMPSRPEPDTP